MPTPGAETPQKKESDQSNNQTHVVGQYVTITSTHRVRYEGFVESVNKEAKQITLSRVSCFGTEGRRNGIGEQPPSDMVYSRVTFKVELIQKMEIKEPPPILDPAIVTTDEVESLQFS